jgi:hypothetical protein
MGGEACIEPRRATAMPRPASLLRENPTPGSGQRGPTCATGRLVAQSWHTLQPARLLKKRIFEMARTLQSLGRCDEDRKTEVKNEPQEVR